MTTFFIFIVIVIFLAGMYHYVKAESIYKEGFTTNKMDLSQPRCPNMLIQKGSQFYLYNSKLAKIPGVNPVEFDNLEDYTEFLDWQRSQGIRCPVMYLQQTYDAQGNEVYKVRPSPTDLQGGLQPNMPTSQLSLPNPTKLIDATQDDHPYNINSFPAQDQTSYYVGTTTPLDQMNIAQQQPGTISPNAMDPNWGGSEYTETLVKKGYYKGNNVSLYVD